MRGPWLVQRSSPVRTGHVSLPEPFLAALYRTHAFKARGDGRPPRLNLGIYQPDVFGFSSTREGERALLKCLLFDGRCRDAANFAPAMQQQ